MSSNESPKRKAATLSPQAKMMASGGNKQQGGLELFGIKPSKKSPSNNNKSTNRDSYIKMAVINDEDEGCSILFRFEPKENTDNSGSWSEKVMFESLRSGARFVRLLNVNQYCEHFFKNNEPVVNNRGYKIRMFIIPCDNRPPEQALHGLATRICKEVNAMPGNNTIASVQEGSLLWLTEDVVWSDAIGVDRAFEKLCMKTGQPGTNFYEENISVIHTFFHRETFSMDLARALHAPIEQVHPDLRADLQEGQDIEGSYADDFVMPNNGNNNEGNWRVLLIAFNDERTV